MIVWLASFPRSGNTFCRTLLHELYGQKSYWPFEDPEIKAMQVAGHVQTPAPVEELARHEQVYFVKTHAQPSDASPAIYLLRDGRDSYVSLAHHLMMRTLKPRSWEPSVLRLIGKTYLLEVMEFLIHQSSWSEHALRWTRRTAGKTFVIRFEDLIREPERCIDEALRALGMPFPRTGDQTVPFDWLHKQWPTFFRRGQVGSWRDEMPPHLYRMFWRRHGYAMRTFGYLDGAPPPLESPSVRKRSWPSETRWDQAFAKLPKSADSEGSRSVSLTSLGRHGRWGNTVFQYMFLKSFAREHGLQCEVPPWIGQRLFGHDDFPIASRHPTVVRDNMTLLSESSNHIKGCMDFVANRAGSLAEQGRTVYFLNELKIAASAEELPFKHADLEGLFMVHSRYLAPYREYLRELLRPAPAIADQMQQLRERLRARGKTIIGIHVRRGDFDRVYSGQGYEFVVPPQWHLKWLDSIWSQAEDPVLLICSDNLKAVLPDFARFNPVTAESLGAEMPPDIGIETSLRWQRRADFFPDWYLLSQCDRLAISNSTFSFTAAMLNERCAEFVRPSLVHQRLVPFDPWDAQPVLFLEQRATVPGEFASRIRIARAALGDDATWPGIRLALSTYRVMMRNRAIAARYFEGNLGLARELATPAFYLASRRTYGESLQ